jgi:DNA-binding GntR family transcriptional regulator
MTETAPAFAEPRHRTMAEAALAELREAILTGVLAPGAPMRLEELAGSLNMSISPIREAIRQLEALGLAEHLPHRGARVTQLTIDDLRNTYEARLALETLAIRRAAGRFSDEDAVAARAALDEYARAVRVGDGRLRRAVHATFHFTLYDASGSTWLPRLIRPVWENAERYRVVSVAEGRAGSLAERQREHQQILDACTRHDADAAANVLHSHLARTANVVAKHMGHGRLF